VRKIWSLVFLTVPILGVGLFAMAPACGWWMPEGTSTYARDIDHLFNVILGITGVAFIATQAALVAFLWKYHAQGVAGERATYTHGNHRLEIVWTIIPAAILVFIAFYQFGTWKEVKWRSEFTKDSPPLFEVTAGQFEWRFTYPGEDGKFGTPDDVHSLNEFHVPVNKKVVFDLKTRDVLHSFFVPTFRIKQDAVPGITIPVWFQAMKEGRFELVCAELCGWGHYKMRGMVTVESEAAFRQWLTTTKAAEEVVE